MKIWSVVLAALGALAGVPHAIGQELFLKPERSVISRYAQPQIRLINGSFRERAPPLPRDRLRDVLIVGSGRVPPPRERTWYDDSECLATPARLICGMSRPRETAPQTASILKYAVGDGGTYVIDVSTVPEIVSMSAEDFTAQLTQAGADDVLAAFQTQRTLDQVRERRVRQARAIVQVGEEPSSDYSKALRHPVEIVLDHNPYEIKVGDSVAFRVLYKKQPIANQLVSAGYEGIQAADSSAAPRPEQLRTDSNGRAILRLTARTLWYLSLIYIRKIDDANADYEATWATVTFRPK
jgi:hypothetical protein